MAVPLRARGGVIRVLVADSNLTQSHLLGSALRRQSGFTVACCESELYDCLHALELSPVDVILWANGLANDSSCLDVEAVRTLHQRYPHTSLVMLVDAYDRDLVISALRAGVRGLFCRASQPFKALCKCIHVVHEGQFWANNEQLMYLIDALEYGPKVHVTNSRGEALLTPREEQVIGQVAAGLANVAIAHHLGMAESTVKKYLLRIFDKLGVSNRVELALYALTQREMKMQEGALTAVDSVPEPGPRKKEAALPSDMSGEPYSYGAKHNRHSD
jgi:DNA-binding NarL/FixJ family response regulator